MNISKFKKHLRSNQTNAETKLWYFLRAKRFHGFKFRRQVAIGHYVVDFICFKSKLIVELDGGQHNEVANKRADLVRTNYLRAQGYRVIRFWNDEVFTKTSEVLNEILKNLSPLPRNLKAPRPLPQGER
ncbi:MAG: putative restriction endonuclease-like [Gammaproteobacteria bacterium]|jgi:very-short-patch-repair endonuclease|nr:putative restriction endonuclease-like [Gammaproteobacteria bacterium]